MKRVVAMGCVKGVVFWVLCLAIVGGVDARAAMKTYVLDDVVLVGGERITGLFDWAYEADDFEGGSGAFTSLDIPYTPYSFAAGNLDMVIETNSIEISGNGNFHDMGLDIKMKFPEDPFTPTEAAVLDLGLSFFECCGNGFRDQEFAGGRVSPVIPGDANVDGVVSIGDLSILASHFGDSPGAGSWKLGDFNYDGLISIGDVSILAGNFGMGSAAVGLSGGGVGISVDVAASLAGIEVAGVPEPGVLGVLGLGVLVAATRLRVA